MAFPVHPRRGYIFPCCPLVLQRQSRLLLQQSSTATGFFSIWCVCKCLVKPYRGGGRQDDVSDGGFKLVDGGSVLMRAVVWLNGLDFYFELPGFVFVLWVAGRIEGILFGMWAKNRVKETTTERERSSTVLFYLSLNRLQTGVNRKTNTNWSVMSY